MSERLERLLMALVNDPRMQEADRKLEEALTRDSPLLARVAADSMHPTGRCSCAGEGHCDWCRENPEP